MFGSLSITRGALIAGMVVAAIASIAATPVRDSDYFWHVAAGRHLFDGILLSGVDHFSWTAAGHPWIAHEWLSEVAMAWVDGLAGPFGNSILAAAIVATAFFLLMVRLRYRGFTWAATLPTVLLAFAASLVTIGVRVQMLELLYLSLALLLLDRWLLANDRRPLVILCVLAGVWAQTHGSVLLLLIVLGTTILTVALLGDRRWPHLALTTAVGALVVLANPFGARLYSFAAGLVSDRSLLDLIQEWRPPDFQSLSFAPFELEILVIVASLSATMVRRAQPLRGRPGSAASAGEAWTEGAQRRTHWVDLILLVLFLHLALQSARHVMLFGLVAAPALATVKDRFLSAASSNVELRARLDRLRPQSWRSAKTESELRSRTRLESLAAGIVALALLAGGLSRIAPANQDSIISADYPDAAIPALQAAAEVVGEPRLLNDYAWGGFLIERAPSVPVFVDGRTDIYVGEQLNRYVSILSLDSGWKRTLEDLRVNLALLRTGSPLAEALTEAGWRRLWGDKLASLLVSPHP